jgi:hypothetical protein
MQPPLLRLNAGERHERLVRVLGNRNKTFQSLPSSRCVDKVLFESKKVKPGLLAGTNCTGNFYWFL